MRMAICQDLVVPSHPPQFEKNFLVFRGWISKFHPQQVKSTFSGVSENGPPRKQYCGWTNSCAT